MKFLAIAAALVASVAASPSGWGGPGYGGGYGFNRGFGGGGWGLRNPIDFQTASNVCGSGNTVMCCNESQYREDFNSNNAGLLGLMNGLEGPGTGLFGQCNNFNIGCKYPFFFVERNDSHGQQLLALSTTTAAPPPLAARTTARVA